MKCHECRKDLDVPGTERFTMWYGPQWLVTFCKECFYKQKEEK